LPGAAEPKRPAQPAPMADPLLAALAGSRRPAIVGLAKNAGKTTVLNYLIKALYEAGRRPGIASIGRDGEQIDILTLKRKPRILLPPGCHCVTTNRLASAELELCAELGGRGVLGMPGVYRNPAASNTVSGGKWDEAVAVELAGINRIAAMEHALEKLAGYADPVLVDGALDRRSQGSPGLSVGVVLCTGAVVGNSLELVVKRTMDVIGLLQLPAARGSDLPADNTIQISGAVTDRKMRSLLTGHGNNNALTIVAEDWTRFFLSAAMRRTLSNRGISLAVIRSARLLALCVNPHNPVGTDLPAEALRTALAHALSEKSIAVPCVDVQSEPK
jgi:hypothetical protein